MPEMKPPFKAKTTPPVAITERAIHLGRGTRTRRESQVTE